MICTRHRQWFHPKLLRVFWRKRPRCSKIYLKVKIPVSKHNTLGNIRKGCHQHLVGIRLKVRGTHTHIPLWVSITHSHLESLSIHAILLSLGLPKRPSSVTLTPNLMSIYTYLALINLVGQQLMNTGPETRVSVDGRIVR